MALTTEEILEHVRALPPRDRMKLVERVVHEVAEAEGRKAMVTEGPPLWEDVSDEEYESFLEAVRRNRREQPMRTPR